MRRCPAGPALRANIAETLSPVLITEQGENGNHSEYESEAEWICLGQCAASSPAPARPNPEVVADAATHVLAGLQTSNS